MTPNDTMPLDAVLDAVQALGRAFRLEGDRLVLTAPAIDSPADITPELAQAIRHHKPAIVAMLGNPLVRDAMEAFGITTARPIGDDEYRSMGFVQAKQPVQSGSAPTSTAASDGGAEP